MNISYVYTKSRKDFGKQPMFCEVPVHILDSIDPNSFEQQNYCLRNPVDRESQATTSQTEHDVNTEKVILQDLGMNHVEGGWPKEINFDDEELTSRHLRRILREDAYVEAVIGSYSKFEHLIKQNNAIDMYEMYFKNMPPEQPVEKYTIQLKNVYRDSQNRSVSCIDWTYEKDSKLVVAYCNKEYPIMGPVNFNFTCYTWDQEITETPSNEFCPLTPCWQIACSPFNPSLIIGGLNDGRVCIFDIRAQKETVNISAVHLAHRDPVTALIFMQSRLNTEFFSGSTDGKCMWWDVRNLSIPTDDLIMSVNIPHGESVSMANAEPVTALQFDHALPTRFLCGTDTGLVIKVNRKGKTHMDKMSSSFHAHKGPVRAVHVSPCTSKMFITCGDWSVHIWSEEIKTSPIITGTSQRHQIHDVIWAPHRFSSYMSVSGDGNFYYWDLLRKYREPIYILPLSKKGLLKLKSHLEGQLIATGDTNGSIYLLSLSENLVLPGERDKQLMIQTYDLEKQREHNLENRVKEILLKIKAEEENDGEPSPEEVDAEALIMLVEEEYKKVVLKEMCRSGITSSSHSSKVFKMRKR